MTLDQLDTIIARHTARDIPFNSPSWQRHAAVRWRLENRRLALLNQREAHNINFNGEANEHSKGPL